MEFLFPMAPCAASPSGNSQVDPRKPSATHPFSLPSYLGLSNGDHLSGGGSSNDDPAPYTPNLSMDPEDNQDSYGSLGTWAASAQLRRYRHAAPKKAPQCGQFLGKLRAMLEDDAMKGYIAWCEVEGSEGLSIPDIQAFVDNALPEYFPDMNKHWASFQKQLSNYGYRKQGRDKNKGLYIRSDKRFCRDRPYPLPEVGRQAKAAKPQPRVQEQPLAVTTPAVSGPPGQLDPWARIYHLEKQVEAMAKRLERLERLETLLSNLPPQLGALITGDGSPNPQAHDGPAVGGIDNDYSFHGADNPSDVDHQAMPDPPIDTHDDWASQSAPPYAVTEGMAFDSDVPPQQSPAPQSPTDTSFAGLQPTFAHAPMQPPPTFTHASRQPAVEVSAPQGSGMPSGSAYLESSTLWNWPFVLLQEAGLAAFGQSSSPDASATASTSQAPDPSRSSSSTGAFGGRKQFGGMHPVPRLPQAGLRPV